MSRTERDFYARSEEEQQAFLAETWCNACMEADLGMVEPVEYEEQGRLYVEGKCSRCGAAVVTELIDEEL